MPLNRRFKPVAWSITLLGVLSAALTLDAPKLHGAQPTCANLSDHFCKAILWSAKNNGNLVRGPSRYAFGPSKRKDIPELQIIQLQAVLAKQAAILAALPKPFHGEGVRLFGELGEILQSFHQRTVTDVAWEQSFSLWQIRLAYFNQRVIYDKLYEKFPHTRHISNEDWSIAEKTFFSERSLELQSQIQHLTYSDHPDWVRVKTIFIKAKKNLATVINSLSLPAPMKKAMLTHLDTTILSLPYGDPRRMVGCDSGELNAFYSPSHHKITVCPSLFLSMAAEPPLYLVMAHELAHSFDPSALIRASISQDAFFLSSLRLANNPKMSCKEWENLKAGLVKFEPDIKKPQLPLESFSSCLVGNTQLKDWEQNLLKQQADTNARSYMSYLSRRNYFSTLISPTYRRQDGSTVANPYFLNPDALYRQKEGFVRQPVTLHSLSYLNPVAEIFALEYRCAHKDDKALPMPSDTEFKDYLDSVYGYLVNREMREFSYFGREHQGLQAAGFARASSENFADWMAYKSLPLELRQLPSAAAQRAYSEEMGALFCDKPSPLDSIHHLVEIEGDFNLDPHATNRGRRMNAFTSEVASLLSCTPEPEVVRSFSACKL